MEVKVKFKGPMDTNHIEIDLTEPEIENIKKGRYPSVYADVNGINYCFSVGTKR